MTNPTNTAAYLVSEKAHPLEVREAPYPTPGPNEFVIQAHAVAINPADFILQDQTIPFPLPSPYILGHDVAGTVLASAHPAYPAGTRVLGLSTTFDTQDASSAAFQQYVKLAPPMTTRLPDAIPFEAAATLPLGVATASAGLFEAAHLGLRYPGAAAGNDREKEVVLVWGAASSVGAYAVQLARGAGYDVFGVASAANGGYVRDVLGAAAVFDYREEGVVGEILEALEGRRFAGAYDAVSQGGAVEACLEVAGRVGEGGKRFVSSVGFLPEGVKVPEGVQTNRIWGSMSRHSPVGKAVFEDFLPGALEDGRFVPAPKAEVVGKGLENVQKAIDILRKGVSAKKLVVSL
ncbi:Zinc-binding alcohol dehydrogenase domain-containing protein cipB [Botryosphaeria dothidea]|uniref:Zinc-binding alcohol dehydrogenase domain-containing protein cipB n=1 Tax=Botryosphaeria dothidea TaxID=55169 RepID=A0A8H4IJV9_9PEZI|nr:Zinc-binding alcohol dehydrogenase domain-containing protein cipB [Botryosphaeria dothidea]